MFFNIGAGEMMLIAIVLLIAVGPEQLPGVIRKVGRTMGELKSMSDRLRDDFMTGINQIEEATDVKSWADKLETPWAEPIDNSSWARNVDPPFTAGGARSEGSEASGSDDGDDGNDDGAGPDTVEHQEVDPAPAAASPGDGEPGPGVESPAPARPTGPNTRVDEPATSTNGHLDPSGPDGGADEAADPMAGERE